MTAACATPIADESMVDYWSAPLSGMVLEDVPVTATEGELLWAAPGSLIRRIPTSRVTFIVTAGRADGSTLAEYVLDHTAG